jgi:hypothetical protein
MNYVTKRVEAKSFQINMAKLLRSFYMNIFKPNLGAHLPLLWPKVSISLMTQLFVWWTIFCFGILPPLPITHKVMDKLSLLTR